ncbi:coiled-coil domain containing 169 [Gadus chalcogrammus]|uniref:coiled-coil domain containing 169 n=1 Tax=Gadus chalcogrammus TaxID=1042646 RepID=UPI0024C418E8|nr:coiled-coil domain containing 169 [Gadus chalcogrammus]
MSAVDADFHKYDLARLQAELRQEKEMKDMLEESVSDLRGTMRELQERLHSVDGEGNEWKTRYETQIELNGQLQRQISMVHDKLEDLRGNPMDRLASVRSYEDMPSDALQQRLKLLTNEKAELQSHLMDCRVGIEEEGKAFHRTNDERRAYLSEIAKLSSTLEANRRVQYPNQPRGAPESQQKKSIREKQASRRADTESKGGGGGAPKPSFRGSARLLSNHSSNPTPPTDCRGSVGVKKRESTECL